MNIRNIKVGLRVMCNGFAGTIVRLCEWSRTEREIMVEVRLASGVTCVSNLDLRAVQS